MPSVNILAVLLGAIVSMVIGFAWYSKPLFAKMWMRANNIDEKKMKDMNKHMPIMYGLTFASALVTAYVLGVCMRLTGNYNPVGGVKIAFLLWLGFSTTVQLTNWVFSGKAKTAYFLDTAYTLVTMLIMAVVIGFWR